MNSPQALFISGAIATVLSAIYVFWPQQSTRSKGRKRGGPTGLYNVGNSCFLNAVLQALAACPSIGNWLEQAVSDVQQIDDELMTIDHHCHQPLLAKTVLGTLKVLNNEMPWDDNSYSPAQVLAELRAKQWVISAEEQDAHEMYHVLTSTMEEELRVPHEVPSLFHVPVLKCYEYPEGGDQLQRIVPRLVRMDHRGRRKSDRVGGAPFHGLLASQLTCTNCQHRSPLRCDTFDSLSLTISPGLLNIPSLESSLYQYVRPELVHGVDCAGCAKQSTFATRLSIAKLPRTLCMHVQRTVWLSNGQAVKKADYVSFPEMLNVDDFVYNHHANSTSSVEAKSSSKLLGGNNSSQSLLSGFQVPAHQQIPRIPTASAAGPMSVDKSRRHDYRLQAVVEHIGDVSSGHFVTYRRHGNQWYHTSDVVVREVPLTRVMRACAYLLFYEAALVVAD